MQAISSGLMGKEKDFLEAIMDDPQYSGHPMPGYEMYLADTDETKEFFTLPSQDEINAQDTIFLRQCWDLYMKYKMFGLPNGTTYLDEKPSIIKIIEMCERESNKYQSWAFKQKDLKDR